MRSLPPVTIVCPDLTSNAAGRALLLAELLATETDVRLAGAVRGEGLWEPLVNSPIPVMPYRWSSGNAIALSAVRWFAEMAGDDILVVSKPLIQSLGLALAGRRSGRRLIVDIDDWETGFAQIGANREQSSLMAAVNRAYSYVRRGGANKFVATRLLEACAARMPHRVVSNSWLQRRFGGRILYHVRDPGVLDPGRLSDSGPRLSDDRCWIGFVGTPRFHKGILVLIEALAQLKGDSAPGLALMGASEGSDPEVAVGRRLLSPERFVTLPPFPFTQLQEHLAAVDIVAIPSLDIPAARGQIPAKVFDALAMAKPVIASRVNDLPRIVEGCGIVVEPGDAAELSRAIASLVTQPDLRQKLGNNGRRKLLLEYSYDVGRRVLVDLVQAAAQ